MRATNAAALTTRLSIWLAAAMVLAALLVVHQVTRSTLSDPDPARQRPDLLDANHRPFLAPAVTPAVPAPRRKGVVFFTRPGLVPSLTASLSRDHSLRAQATLVIVVSRSTALAGAAGVPVVFDAGLAPRFHLDRPVDGGPPVGYAVIASSGFVVYETLDPGAADHLIEVETMLGATK